MRLIRAALRAATLLRMATILARRAFLWFCLWTDLQGHFLGTRLGAGLLMTLFTGRLLTTRRPRRRTSASAVASASVLTWTRAVSSSDMSEASDPDSEPDSDADSPSLSLSLSFSLSISLSLSTLLQALNSDSEPLFSSASASSLASVVPWVSTS